MSRSLLNNSIEVKKDGTLYHDPQYLRFNTWSALLSFKNIHLAENRKKQKAIFLKQLHKYPNTVKFAVNTYISINNNCDFLMINLNVYSKKAGKTIFRLPELPDKKSISLMFKEKGAYELYFFVVGSTAFTKTTLNIYPEEINPKPKNFDWDLNPNW